jgi:alkanesulfonate monooxygenase SsuD/methylene tetrahydromethanopterin reductase-like flavin-dependent oxidoreductase (luciferase family)
MSEARQRYAQLHESATGELRVLVCLAVVLGETEEIARSRATELDGMAAPSGDLRFIGTPEQLAEIAAGWQAEGACDGFHLLPSVLPDDLDLLVDRVVPLLRERGLTRAGCTGSTLREHFGLKRPRSQYEKAS